MLSSIRKLGGARLHLLAEHGRLNALLEAYGPAASLALERTFFRQPCKAYSSSSRDAAGEGLELTLPDDLSVIGRLNPQLRDVILAHQKFERENARGGLRSRLQELLSSADGNKRSSGSGSLTKTALSRLRVDQLRQVLEEENADPRGNKDVLVLRLLGLLAEGDLQAGQVLPAMEEFKEGIVTRRQVSQQERRAARRAQDAATYGVPEASLREAQAAAVVEKARFATVLSPDEVAEMLVEARAADVCIIDVRRRCPFADYMVVGTARSQALVRQLAGGVLHRLKGRCKEVAPGVVPSIEGGKEDSEWMVVDAGSVVVHIFLEGWREEYNLEGLWGERDGTNLRWLQPKQTVQTLQTLR